MRLDKETAERLRKELSYAFRPLTKNGYISKGKDGRVSILAKGRALYPEVTPLISTGGGEQERKRVMQAFRMAMWMAEHGFPAEEAPGKKIVFIPSARWRNIAPGILSTSRFVGMLVGCGHRLADYVEPKAASQGSLRGAQSPSPLAALPY